MTESTSVLFLSITFLRSFYCLMLIRSDWRSLTVVENEELWEKWTDFWKIVKETASLTELWWVNVDNFLHYEHIEFSFRENTVFDVQKMKLLSVEITINNLQLWILCSLSLKLVLKLNVRWKSMIDHFIVNDRA